MSGLRVPCDCWCACAGDMPEEVGWAGQCHKCASGDHTEQVDHILTLDTTGGAAVALCRCGATSSPTTEARAGAWITVHRQAFPPAAGDVVMPNAWAVA